MIYKTLHRKLTNEQYVSHALKSRPHVVNQLTVSISSGKGRLILDLQHVSKQGHLTKCKFED
jgi:hypothetical protein